jgi:hypothetical protein
MIKCFCDKCKKEIQINELCRVGDETSVKSIRGDILAKFDIAHEFCGECYTKYERLNVSLCKFMEMSNEEIELALYTFKVGDKVITDDGRIGIITDICTCDKCKERGFYEPKVKLEVGLDSIWITDRDKDNGFINFYSIGDQVFGNIDEKCFDRIKEQISERKRELVELEAQLNVARSLKEAEDK